MTLDSSPPHGSAWFGGRSLLAGRVLLAVGAAFVITACGDSTGGSSSGSDGDGGSSSASIGNGSSATGTSSGTGSGGGATEGCPAFCEAGQAKATELGCGGPADCVAWCDIETIPEACAAEESAYFGCRTDQLADADCECDDTPGLLECADETSPCETEEVAFESCVNG
jgi:hypothetical protein